MAGLPAAFMPAGPTEHLAGKPGTQAAWLAGVAQDRAAAVAVAVLAVLGLLAVVRASRARARRIAVQARAASQTVSLAGRMLVTAAVITGGQWAVWTAHTSTAVRVAVLAVP